MAKSIDISKYPNAIGAINDILSRGHGSAEVKIERSGTELVIVEQRRDVKSKSKLQTRNNN